METWSFEEGYCSVGAFVSSGRKREVHAAGFGKPANWNQLLLQRGTVLLVREDCWGGGAQDRKD